MMHSAIGAIAASRQVSSYIAETQALLARFSGSYSTDRQTAINTLIQGLKDDGLWTTFDCLWIPAAPNSSDAVLNWINASYSLTLMNSPAFTADRGYKGNASSMYLKTGYVPSMNAVNPTQDSTTVGAYVNVAPAASGSSVQLLGVRSPSTFYTSQHLSNTASSSSINNEGGGTPTVGSGVGLYSASRTASTTTKAYKNGGTTTATSSSSSVGLPDREIYLLSRNSLGTAVHFSNARIAAAFVASGWNDTQHSNFYSRLYTYLNSFGAA